MVMLLFVILYYLQVNDDIQSYNHMMILILGIIYTLAN